MQLPEAPADPLSGVLALLKPSSCVAGGFSAADDMAVRWPKHRGIKCYAVISGQCWLTVETVPEPVLLRDGDCFLLPRGLPFALATDLALTPVDYLVYRDSLKGKTASATPPDRADRYIVGGYFALTGSHAEQLLSVLPPIVHIRNEPDKATMRWSLERMRQELRDPQPGGTLIAQQLAYMMLVQALRLHLAESAGGVGWFSALADKQMSAAMTAMHDRPGHSWTLQSLAERAGMSRSVFALRFRQTVGSTPMEYLTRWRMLLAADRLKNSADSVSAIALSLAYDSESAFSKAFRRVMGCSPRHSRNQASTHYKKPLEPQAVAASNPSQPQRVAESNPPQPQGVAAGFSPR